MPTDDAADGGFLSRWSRRKLLVRQGVPQSDPAVPADPAAPADPPPVAPLPVRTDASPIGAAPAAVPLAPATAGPLPAEPAPGLAAAPAPPPPTLADVAALTRDSDYARFVAPGVDTGVKNAALKKLFTDPHFNIMDRLDTYIDDYGQPDPLPPGMLQQMAQSRFLGLFSGDDAPPAAVPAVAPGTPDALAALPPNAADPTSDPEPLPDEDATLRLQPHAAAGPDGAGAGPGQDAGRQC